MFKILRALTEDRSMSSTDWENNIFVYMVQRMPSSCSYQFNRNNDYLPEHLAFNEFKGVERTLHFICLETDKYEVVQILRTRYKKQLLHTSKSFSQRLYIESIVFGYANFYNLLTKIRLAENKVKEKETSILLAA